jgi:anaerobic ribonucleoside-triphosphate reductase activating protein
LLNEMTVTLHGVADDSIVDGPGMRLAIFTQGCRHSCAGCHNPDAQSFEGGTPTTTTELWEKVVGNPLLLGITLTGGEPFDQADALIELARKTRERGLTVWAYSGYRYEELLEGVPSEAATRLLGHVTVLVDGPFVEALRSLDLPWRGSSNQRVIDVRASREAGHAVEWTP